LSDYAGGGTDHTRRTGEKNPETRAMHDQRVNCLPLFWTAKNLNSRKNENKKRLNAKNCIKLIRETTQEGITGRNEFQKKK